MLVSVTPLAAAGLYLLIAGDLSLAEGIAATGVVLLACIMPIPPTASPSGQSTSSPPRCS
jgi:hypothetical protein